MRIEHRRRRPQVDPTAWIAPTAVLSGAVTAGPHAYLSGCQVGARTFIATGAMVFNGATLGEACTVALGGMVHDGKSRAEIMDAIMTKYARALGTHRYDQLLTDP